MGSCCCFTRSQRFCPSDSTFIRLRDQTFFSSPPGRCLAPTQEKAEQLLTGSRKILFDTRAKRPRPARDDKIVTAWNGLMISAFARASQLLGDPAYLEAAKKAADFVRQKLYRAETSTLLRSYRQGASDVSGFASDYAFFIQGLLDLYTIKKELGRRRRLL